MAREVTEIEGYGPEGDGVPRSFTVASGVFIAKGTVLTYSTPRTAIASTGSSDLFAGIAAADKSATDFTTRISAWQNGIYEFTASGTVTAGDVVVTADPGNYVMTLLGAPGTASGQIIVGYALKTGTNARIQVRVNN